MIFDKLKAHIWQALSAILFVALCGVGIKLFDTTRDLDKARAALATEQRDRAQENEERMRVALDDARETFRKNELHTRRQQEITDANTKQERARAAALAAAVADGKRLRSQVAQFAAACGGRETDSPAAALEHCRNRATTLGELLGEADGLAEEFAGAAERHADEIRTLKAVTENDRRRLLQPGPAP